MIEIDPALAAVASPKPPLVCDSGGPTPGRGSTTFDETPLCSTFHIA
jgi:hypothetical protein